MSLFKVLKNCSATIFLPYVLNKFQDFHLVNIISVICYKIHNSLKLFGGKPKSSTIFGNA